MATDTGSHHYLRGVYQHDKTGNLYIVLFCAIDANSETKRRDQVIYKQLDGDDVYTRNYDEFCEKFTFCNIVKLNGEAKDGS